MKLSVTPGKILIRLLAFAALLGANLTPGTAAEATPAGERRLLYVAAPGIRDYLEYGGHGVLVFDMDHGHSFVRRIAASGRSAAGRPLNVKGICASAVTQRLYVSTTETVTCFDLTTDKILWEKAYSQGCDRLAISPDGQVIYIPSFEKDEWYVINALNGDTLTTLVPKAGAHNTIYSLDGAHAYLAGLKSNMLRVTDTKTHTITREIGPFAAPVRPFTINGKQTLCFANVNDLLGFEVADLTTGKVIQRVVVEGFEKGPIKRHGCPSHGIGLTPDEKELWLCDAANQRVHIYDATLMPPKQVASIAVRDQPGWVTFSLDGKLAYPSTGEVVDVATHKIIATLTDETGAAVASEKLLEIDFAGSKAVRTGDQFGLGRVVK